MQKEGKLILILALVVLVVSSTAIYFELSKSKEIVVEEPKAVIVEEPIVIEEPKAVEQTPKEVIISISRYEFDKPEITIEAGTKVIWKNIDTRRHMISSKRVDIFRDRKSLEYGDTFEHTFNDPGVYEIIEANFGINGKITVTEKEDLSSITGNAVKIADEKVVVEEKPDVITAYVVKNVEVDGSHFLLLSINLFVISLIALLIGFYASRHKKHNF